MRPSGLRLRRKAVTRTVVSLNLVPGETFNGKLSPAIHSDTGSYIVLLYRISFVEQFLC